MQAKQFKFTLDKLSVEDIIFLKTQTNEPLKENYVFVIDLYGINSQNDIHESKLIMEVKHLE